MLTICFTRIFYSAVAPQNPGEQGVRHMNIVRLTLTLFSVLLLCVAARFLAESQTYSSWESVEGELHHIYLHNASSPTVGGASDFGHDVGKALYSYSVNGNTFQSNRIIPLQFVYLPRHFVTSLKPGTVEVTYNPLSPSQSYIYAIPPYTQVAMLVLVSFLAVASALYLPRIKVLFVRVANYA